MLFVIDFYGEKKETLYYIGDLLYDLGHFYDLVDKFYLDNKNVKYLDLFVPMITTKLKFNYYETLYRIIHREPLMGAKFDKNDAANTYQCLLNLNANKYFDAFYKELRPLLVDLYVDDYYNEEIGIFQLFEDTKVTNAKIGSYVANNVRNSNKFLDFEVSCFNDITNSDICKLVVVSKQRLYYQSIHKKKILSNFANWMQENVPDFVWIIFIMIVFYILSKVF